MEKYFKPQLRILDVEIEGALCASTKADVDIDKDPYQGEWD